MKISNRVKKLPPYIFAELDKAKEDAIKQGKDLIVLSIGDPDITPPRIAIDAMHKALDDPAMHRYPSYIGSQRLRQTITNYMKNRFGTTFDSNTETIVLIGSKEGIAHLMLAFVDPQDVVLLPDPGFPMYTTSAMFAGGVPVKFKLEPERNFLPDLSKISEEDARKASIILVNYPNNPTGAMAPLSFFEELVSFAKQYDLLIVQDAAYAEIYSNKKPHSIFEVEGAKEVAIEIHSFSKTFSAAGWRLGFAVGNADAILALAKVKDQIDSGPFDVVQEGAAMALAEGESTIAPLRDEWNRRRRAALEELYGSGLDVFDGASTLYLWIRVPANIDSSTFCKRLLEEEAVLATPGVGFGNGGEGWFRIALCTPEDRIREGIRRIKRFAKRFEQ